MTSSLLVRAVFALVATGTIAAFVVTQQLKSEFPLVIRFAASPPAFSPNGDGKRDFTTVGFDLSEDAEVSFEIIDSEGQPVRRIVDDRPLEGDTKHRFRWYGRDDDGRRLPDGTYRMQVIRRDEGRVIGSFKEISLDTEPPRVRFLSAEPGLIAPDEGARVRLRYAGPRNEAPEFRIFRTDDGPVRVVSRFRGRGRGAVWDGTVRGHPAAEGNYAFNVTVRDRAGNLARSPAPDLPTPDLARPGTGVVVRGLTLTGPAGVVQAGRPVTLEVGPGDRSFSFALSRVGSSRLARRGERIGGSFRVHVPETAHTGVYLVRVRSGRRRAVWPLAVSGRPQTRAAGSRPLVVLPWLSWQALNPWDSDRDGFAETLLSRPVVPVRRPFEDGALPPRFRSQAAPLLRFLDRIRTGYDITTDYSLALGEGPSLGNAPGLAFAGSPGWVTPQLAGRLQSYVREGGRVATFGAEAFTREASLEGRILRREASASRRDAFGERTRLFRTVSAPLVVESDELGLFDGLDRFVGEFSVFERSLRLPRAAETLASAGRDPGEPAFLAYRLGDGMVLRTGTPQWSRELGERRLSLEVPRVTRRIFELLARR